MNPEQVSVAMSDFLFVLSVVTAYLGTMMGLIFLMTLCRVGDLGILLFGWLDSKIQKKAAPAKSSHLR